jgi:LysM repeat protein
MYKVKKGDSLLKLSFITGIGVKSLSNLNKIANNTIVEDMVMKFPRELLKYPEHEIIHALGPDSKIKKKKDPTIEDDWVLLDIDRQSVRSGGVSSFLNSIH